MPFYNILSTCRNEELSNDTFTSTSGLDSNGLLEIQWVANIYGDSQKNKEYSKDFMSVFNYKTEVEIIEENTDSKQLLVHSWDRPRWQNVFESPKTDVHFRWSSALRISVLLKY